MATEVRRSNVVLRQGGQIAVAWSGYDGDDDGIYVAQRGPDDVWGDTVAVSVAGQNATLPSLTQGQGGAI